MRCFHPVSLLLCWLLLALPFVALDWRFGLAVLLIAYPLWPIAWQSMWRMKWLLLAMLLSPAWTLPGTPLLDLDWSPTLEGLRHGFVQAFSLLWLVCGLRYCWQLLGRQGMLAALATLCLPLRMIGVPIDVFLLRLILTMQFAEHWIQHPPRWHLDDWQQALAAPPPQIVPDEVKLLTFLWTWRDTALLLLLLPLSYLLWNLG